MPVIDLLVRSDADVRRAARGAVLRPVSVRLADGDDPREVFAPRTVRPEIAVVRQVLADARAKLRKLDVWGDKARREDDKDTQDDVARERVAQESIAHTALQVLGAAERGPHLRLSARAKAEQAGRKEAPRPQGCVTFTNHKERP